MTINISSFLYSLFSFISLCFKGISWLNNDQLFYIGMQDQVFIFLILFLSFFLSSLPPFADLLSPLVQWYTFNMFDTQAWYARDLIMGKSVLPSLEERQKDISEWEEKQEKVFFSVSFWIFLHGF